MNIMLSLFVIIASLVCVIVLLLGLIDKLTEPYKVDTFFGIMSFEKEIRKLVSKRLNKDTTIRKYHILYQIGTLTIQLGIYKGKVIDKSKQFTLPITFTHQYADYDRQIEDALGNLVMDIEELLVKKYHALCMIDHITNKGDFHD